MVRESGAVGRDLGTRTPPWVDCETAGHYLPWRPWSAARPAAVPPTRVLPRPGRTPPADRRTVPGCPADSGFRGPAPPTSPPVPGGGAGFHAAARDASAR